MNLAVIGSGGREHAICYKLKQSPKIKKLICIPGNAGTQTIAKNLYGARKKVLIMPIKKTIKLIKYTANLDVKKIFSI